MSKLNNIPKHWQVKKLRDVCLELESGKRPKGGVQGIETGVPSIGAEHLDFNGNFKFKKIKFVPIEFANQMRKGVIKENDIIVVKDGATTGKTSFVGKSFPFSFAVINEHVFIVRISEKVLPKFVFYKLFSTTGNKEILEDFRGAAQGGISSSFIDKVIIPLPPLPEQQAIVSKIEELFSELDKGVESLKTAQQQLKVYRQSLLKFAFEGRLTSTSLSRRPDSHAVVEYPEQSERGIETTASMPDEGKEKHKNGELTETSTLSPPRGAVPCLPEGWKWVKLGSIIKKIEAGKSFKCDERTPIIGEVGVLKVSALTWQVFNESESKTVIEKEKINKDFFVKQNDFLFSRANTLNLIGAVVIVNSIEKNVMLSDKTLRFVFNSDVLKHYALYYLRSQKGRKEIQRLSTGNQESMRNISQERIKQIEFPLCSLKEQQLIVNELESRLTVCDKIEETINNGLQQSEALRQSVLKKAFEGKLV